jgi:type III pantothenate kinase
MPASLLCVDIGNTLSKAAVYTGGRLTDSVRGPGLDMALLRAWKQQYGLEHAMLSAVADNSQLPQSELQALFTLHFPQQVRNLPIRVAYRTPDTLGADRLACMVAAVSLFPDRPVLVLQCGTCLTVDLLTADAVYMGGSISPGLRMRFQTLNEHTARLPLVAADMEAGLYGESTETSIQAGVWQGYLSECEGMIRKYRAKYEHLKVIITGGDAAAVKDKLKMTIFAFPDLVLYGLMQMLKYDIEKQ